MVLSFFRKRREKKAPPVPEKDYVRAPNVPAKPGQIRQPNARPAQAQSNGPGAKRQSGNTQPGRKSNVQLLEKGVLGESALKKSASNTTPPTNGLEQRVANQLSPDKKVPTICIPDPAAVRQGELGGMAGVEHTPSPLSSLRDLVKTGSPKADSLQAGSAMLLRTEATSTKQESSEEKAPPLDAAVISGKRASALLRPPRINTDQPVTLSPSSPRSMQLLTSPLSAQSMSRHPPASYIRHSRVLSGSSTLAGGLNEMFSRLKPLRHRQREIITDLPHQLSPVVNLSNAQRLRQYAAGPLSVLTADGAAWLSADANLTGTELSIWVLGASKPRYLNVQDCTIVPSGYHVPGEKQLFDLVIMQDYDCNLTTLRFQEVAEMHMWLSALHLAKFEQTSLNEAFTAVVLSLKGPQLSDVYTLLAHKKRFARFEWCNLRLPQVSNKWIKAFMVIIPGDHKKKGRVEMYTSEKFNKKNLVLYVNNVDCVYNVYPEDYHMIDFNLIMKLDGEVFVNKSFEHLFGGEPVSPGFNAADANGNGSSVSSVSSPKRLSRPSSVTSLSLFAAPAAITSATRSRSTSISSALSFFVNAPSPNPDTPSSPSGQDNKKSHFFKKQAVNNFVTTSYVYLMPDSHPGVSAIEIMLRNFVHIIDAFKLYGRPDAFSSDKKDPRSLLFGLPSLPHYCYLDSEDAYGVVAANFDTARLLDWSEAQWRACIKEYVSCLQEDDDYKGCGDISELFRMVEALSPESSVINGDISPLPGLSRIASPKGDNFAFIRGSPDLVRAGRASKDLLKLQRWPSDDESQGGPEQAEEVLELEPRPGLAANARAGARDPFAQSRARLLHPIVDLPTPSEDAQASYFALEKPRPLRL